MAHFRLSTEVALFGCCSHVVFQLVFSPIDLLTNRESNIKFFEATAIREVPGVVFGNHKTYKFVQESQTLQICFSIEHFSQESDK